MNCIGIRPRRIALTVAAGVLTISLLAGAAPAAERANNAPSVGEITLVPSIPIVVELESRREVTNPRHRAIAAVTGLDIKLAGLIVAQADHYGIVDEVIVGVMALETGFTFNKSLVAVNTNGSRDYGLMQVNSGTYPWIAERLNLSEVDPLEPVQNIKMGVWYLNMVLQQCNDDLHCALSRYNGDSTGRYATHVAGIIERYRALLDEALERATREEHKPAPAYGRAA